MRNYLIRLGLFSLLIWAVLNVLLPLLSAAFQLRYVGIISSYFVTLTAVFHYGLMRVSGGKPATFIRYYMAATTLKLFLHLGVLVGVVLFRPSALVPFAITFLIHYLAYTAFEVYHAYRHSRSSATTTNT